MLQVQELESALAKRLRAFSRLEKSRSSLTSSSSSSHPSGPYIGPPSSSSSSSHSGHRHRYVIQKSVMCVNSSI